MAMNMVLSVSRVCDRICGGPAVYINARLVAGTHSALLTSTPKTSGQANNVFGGPILFSRSSFKFEPPAIQPPSTPKTPLFYNNSMTIEKTDGYPIGPVNSHALKRVRRRRVVEGQSGYWSRSGTPRHTAEGASGWDDLASDDDGEHVYAQPRPVSRQYTPSMRDKMPWTDSPISPTGQDDYYDQDTRGARNKPRNKRADLPYVISGYVMFIDFGFCNGSRIM